MTAAFRQQRQAGRATLTAAALLTSLTACDIDPSEPRPDARDPGRRVLALMELTFYNVGTPNLRSSLLVAGSMAELNRLRELRDRGDLLSHELSIPTFSGGVPGNATIQVRPVGTESFEFEGLRYLRATYDVRNAQRTDSTAFDTNRINLTFLPVSTSRTIYGTPIITFATSGGGTADSSLAMQFRPTGAAAVDDMTGELTSDFPDVLQVFTNPEVGSIANRPDSITNVFPYGFVVRRKGNPANRTLPANPAQGVYDGIVNFAYSIPTTSGPVPATISVMLLAVDDSETKLTQSIQEQDFPSTVRVENLAAVMNPLLHLLPKGAAFRGASGERVFCRVRIAGTEAQPTAFMFDPPDGEVWPIPSPFRPGPYFLATNAHLAAARCPGIADPSATNFTVYGFQSGRPAGGYLGLGTTDHAPIPPNGFFAGDVVEVTLTTALGGSRPLVSRYRVASAASSGYATGVDVASGPTPIRLAAADLNGDGNLDVITANSDDSVTVHRGTGTGTFQSPLRYAAGIRPSAIAVGDFNQDFRPDLAVANAVPLGSGSSTVSVLLQASDGSFMPPVSYTVQDDAVWVTTADLNGDGHLDLVVSNSQSASVSVLLGAATGAFTLLANLATQPVPGAIAVGDLNNDGRLDLGIATNSGLQVRIGNGDGSFQAAVLYAPGTPARGVAIGDFNGDGFADVAVAQETIGEIAILRGVGDGTLVPAIALASPTAVAVITADLNGDGRLDLAVASVGGSAINVHLGNGDLTFGAAQSLATDGMTQSVVAGDLNNDGRLDLAASLELAVGRFRFFLGQ